MTKQSFLPRLVFPLHIFDCKLLGVPFPKNFQTLVKNIFKRLFRVYAHIYHSHFPKIVSLGEEAHLNTSFKVGLFSANLFAALCIFYSRIFIGRKERTGSVDRTN
jgi:hypothetical protein